MKETYSYTERNLFNEALCVLIEDFLQNPFAFYPDTVVAIHEQTIELQLTTFNRVDEHWDLYPIEYFLLQNEFGTRPIIDIDVTLDVANLYFLIRE